MKIDDKLVFDARMVRGVANHSLMNKLQTYLACGENLKPEREKRFEELELELRIAVKKAEWEMAQHLGLVL